MLQENNRRAEVTVFNSFDEHRDLSRNQDRFRCSPVVVNSAPCRMHVDEESAAADVISNIVGLIGMKTANSMNF